MDKESCMELKVKELQNMLDMLTSLPGTSEALAAHPELAARSAAGSSMVADSLEGDGLTRLNSENMKSLSNEVVLARWDARQRASEAGERAERARSGGGKGEEAGESAVEGSGVKGGEQTAPGSREEDAEGGAAAAEESGEELNVKEARGAEGKGAEVGEDRPGAAAEVAEEQANGEEPELSAVNESEALETVAAAMEVEVLPGAAAAAQSEREDGGVLQIDAQDPESSRAAAVEEEEEGVAGKQASIALEGSLAAENEASAVNEKAGIAAAEAAVSATDSAAGAEATATEMPATAGVLIADVVEGEGMGSDKKTVVPHAVDLGSDGEEEQADAGEGLVEAV
jgi:hypothetical protein